MTRLYIVTLIVKLYAEYIMWNAQLDESQAGIKIAGRNINNLRYVDDTILMVESEEELSASWWRWKMRVKKTGLKLNIQKTKIMTSSPITSWQIDGEKWKQWQTIFLGSKITADSECTHDIACSLEEKLWQI